MYTNRQILILRKLMKDNSCTIKQLSLLCDASYKTIQIEIKSLNSKLNKLGLKTKIITQRGIGVIMKGSDPDELENFIHYLNESNHELPDYNKEYYVLKIAFTLLQNEYLKIDGLCETLSYLEALSMNF